MRKTLLLTAVLLLVAAFAVAQQTAPDQTQTTPTQNQSQQNPDVNQTNIGNEIRGCLSGSEGNFILTDASGKTYKLEGKADMLKDHVGHEIAVIGNLGAGASASTSANPPSGEVSANVSAGNLLAVSDVRMISEHCASASRGTPSETPSAKSESQMAAGQQPAAEQQIQPSATEPSRVAPESQAAQSTQSQIATESKPEQQPPAAAPESQAAGQTGTESQAPTAEGEAKAADNLPQTASPLPLLALLGLGSIGFGFFSRKKK